MSSKTFPTTNFERELVSAGSRFVIGVDEVGRGAVAGPVAVGVALIDSHSVDLTGHPSKLRDSKLLSEKVRESLIEPISLWATDSAVGMVSAEAIDSDGIIAALAGGAAQALEQILSAPHRRREFAQDGVTIILDGSHNWLAEQAGGLRVVVREKADRDCAVVAAASVVAKVARDRLMVELSQQYPGYELQGHKGYASAAHIDAIRTLGPSDIHRKTWLSKILNTDVGLTD
jgi:ribonuclease HII